MCTCKGICKCKTFDLHPVNKPINPKKFVIMKDEGKFLIIHKSLDISFHLNTETEVEEFLEEANRIIAYKIDTERKIRLLREIMISAMGSDVREDILNEVLEQDEVCAGFCKILKEKDILELFKCKSPIGVVSKTRIYKGLMA